MSGQLIARRGLRFPVAGYTAMWYGTRRMLDSVSPWSLYRKHKHVIRHRSGNHEIPTERDQAIALARMVVQKKNLGISLVPSQALLLSREFLESVYHEEMMRHDP